MQHFSCETYWLVEWTSKPIKSVKVLLTVVWENPAPFFSEGQKHFANTIPWNDKAKHDCVVLSLICVPILTCRTQGHFKSTGGSVPMIWLAYAPKIPAEGEQSRIYTSSSHAFRTRWTQAFLESK